jgi:hypothetical protein
MSREAPITAPLHLTALLRPVIIDSSRGAEHHTQGSLHGSSHRRWMIRPKLPGPVSLLSAYPSIVRP